MEYKTITSEQLINNGLAVEEVNHTLKLLKQWQVQHSPEVCWQHCQYHLLSRKHPFKLHLFLYHWCYHDPRYHTFLGPAIFPNKMIIENSNLYHTMQRLNNDNYHALQQWSAKEPLAFWEDTVKQLNIQFQTPYNQLCDLTCGMTKPRWFLGARMNIIDTIWEKSDPTIPAILSQDPNGPLISVSQEQIRELTAQISYGLTALKLPAKSAIAIMMPMTITAVAAYLAVIQAGFSVIGVADSFAENEIKTRLEIGKAALIITQDIIKRANKVVDLYKRVKQAVPNLKSIVVPSESQLTVALDKNDLAWHDFLGDKLAFKPVACDPHDPTNILFSSGTTGTPKAIPWTHTTPIKCAADAYYHQNIQQGDVLCWPTNLGWMMGPWLIYAALLNGATLALYNGSPLEAGFGEFVEKAKVTMLGLVPSIVKSWRDTKHMEPFNWSSIKVLTSSGECSNGEDMLYLMYLTNYKPIIEYCGGTEIGGAYISSSVVQANTPACFSTPTLGLDFIILNEDQQAADQGEVAIVSPSMGLSTTLLNADHEAVYFKGMPEHQNNQPLRRHGDALTRYHQDCYRLEGRSDDTMNLGGIKISSTEIERCINDVEELFESAAIALPPPEGGPSRLILYVVPHHSIADKHSLQAKLQQTIKTRLNPLFKLYDICIVDSLPRTASNKVMRRQLRALYKEQYYGHQTRN